MAEAYTCPRVMELKPLESPLLNPNFCQEMAANELHAISFHSGNDQLLPDGRLATVDVMQITFPPQVQRVLNPLTDREDYRFANIADPIPTGNITTTLVYNPQPTTKAPRSNRDRIDSLYNRHPCRPRKEVGMLFCGGGGCSDKLYLQDAKNGDPVVFYLQAEGLKKVRDGGVETHEMVPDSIDHFLLPTLLPNSTLLWVAIPASLKKEVNKRRLQQYLNDDIPIVGFNSLIYFYDELEMSFIFDFNDFS